ncbi:TIM-barrel domain-containing protein, partial [Arsukibacterium sp.]|uniref:TIM-barrel domain-containing protein n=1 Tax=Arsukibacterium sp. TaxID=1977258 RepID=UPI00356613A9
MCYLISVSRLLAAFGLLTVFAATAADYQSHRQLGNQLLLKTSEGELAITFFQPQVAEVHYLPDGHTQLPSFAIGTKPAPLTLTVLNQNDHLVYSSEHMSVKIAKSPLKLSFYNGGELITTEQPGFFRNSEQLGFKFGLTAQEKLFGAGQRVLGMDRRGHRLPLYNKAHYGYSTESEQMYFSLAGVMSSNKYMLLFDNSATGHIDLGKTAADTLEFSAVGGRSAYIVVAGDSFPELIDNYLTVSGKPLLPARWTLGSYASRFGYRTEAEARAVVQKYRELGLPLDAIVLDLYWFGPDIKGHMGNLAWDREAFPEPEQMLADFKANGVNTILVTEPFVLTSSKRWQEAVAAEVLAKAADGSPKTFDFYFGNTGLIDVFNPVAADWFWQIYKDLAEQGVAGVWGDLGEPEVHPSDTQHMLGSADEIHNAY